MAERLAIGRMGHRGDGIAEGPEPPVYVPYALPGEIVDVEPVEGRPDRRRVLRVEAQSPARIAPICAHFGTCGGCAVQHWAIASYQEWKRLLNRKIAENQDAINRLLLSFGVPLLDENDRCLSTGPVAR